MEHRSQLSGFSDTCDHLNGMNIAKNIRFTFSEAVKEKHLPMGSDVAFDGKRFIANITGIWSFAYKIHKNTIREIS